MYKKYLDVLVQKYNTNGFFVTFSVAFYFSGSICQA